jgi:hypothetical protein
VRSDVTTVDEYLGGLDDDRRATLVAVRDVVVAHLPSGYDEAMRWGMISYEVPLARYPDTYNGEPLAYAALAAQKRYSSLYLMGVYASEDDRRDFEERYKATGKRLDMGKSCVRFQQADDLPLDLIGEVIAGTSVDEYIARYERARG